MIKENDYAKKRLFKEIRDRVIDCWEPRCWRMKDDDDIGQIYLDSSTIVGGVGRCVQIRRLLFLLGYGFVPDRRKIVMRCGNSKCVNPAHAMVKRFNPEIEKIHEFIDEKCWLSEEDAKIWYFDRKKHEYQSK